MKITLRRSCKIVTSILISGFISAIAISLVFFYILEKFPDFLDVIDLNKISYYAIRTRYIEHPSLVFTPRRVDVALQQLTKGDLYFRELGVDAPVISYTASYNQHGFRTNTSDPPIDVLVVGDSYIEIGETDRSTFSERLKQKSGLSTFNLGRGWYGPYQYLEMFKMFAPQLRPRFALFCIFSGNDIVDIQNYNGWLAGQPYYQFDIGRASFFKRYFSAVKSTISAVRRELRWRTADVRSSILRSVGARKSTRGAGIVHPKIGVVRLTNRSRELSMRFRYKNTSSPTVKPQAVENWRALRSILTEFNELARDWSITPIVVYIPTKLEVYSSSINRHGKNIELENILKQKSARNNNQENIEEISRSLGIVFVDLLPHFKTLASEGKVLYYQFDTHWSVSGREAAAVAVADALAGIE